MFLLKEGKKPFLEFLRNLTPQALLLAGVIAFGSKLDIHRFDPSNWLATLQAGMCLAFFILAFFANFNLYMDASLESLARFGPAGRRLKGRGHGRWTAFFGTLKVIYRKEPKIFFDFVLSIALAEVGWFIVALAGANAAKAALK